MEAKRDEQPRESSPTLQCDKQNCCEEPKDLPKTEESDHSEQDGEPVLRKGYRLSQFEKLVLNEAIEFGLSHFCTGQVFHVPSVSRIIRDQHGR